MADQFKMRCGCSFMVVDGVPHIDLDNLPDCQMTWDFISSGKVKGCFQIESNLGRDWCKKITPRNMEELSAVIAIIRPGVYKAIIDEEKNITMSQKYVNVKNKVDDPFVIHDCITPILEKTYSISLYQEQSLQIARVVAGFDLKEADKLRRSIGRKDSKQMAEVRTSFISGAAKVGKVTPDEANYIFDLIEKSERYSFNKCVTGDAIIEDDFNNLTIEDRYNIYHDELFASKMGYSKVREQWIKDGYFGYGYSLCPDGTFIKNVIRHIEYQGKKDVIEIILPNSLSIRVTSTHKFPTLDGLRKVKDIPFGTKLFVRNQNKEMMPILSIGILPERQKVYDVEMDRPPHNFVANGIVTCNSHSICYAHIAYQTAWLKYHFPQEFFLNDFICTSDLGKQTKEMKEKVNDAKLFGINTLPPKLIGFHKNFFIEEENIRFGLLNIIGVGEAALTKIENGIKNIEEKYKIKIEDIPWFHFMVLTSEFIPSNIMELFIRTGVYDLFGVPRNRMEFEYQKWRKVTDSIASWVSSKLFEFDNLIDALKAARPMKKEGGACKTAKIQASADSILKILENPPYNLIDTPRYVAMYEQKYLGASLTFFGTENLDSENVNTTCKDVLEGVKKPFMCVGVNIDRIFDFKNKNGDTMARLDVSDETGALEGVLVWSDKWEEYEGLLRSQIPLVIQLERLKDNALSLVRVFNAA